MSIRLKFIIVTALLCVLAAAGISWRRAREAPNGVLASLNGSVRNVASDEVPAFMRSLHPVFPYSIIPGGVFSRQELRERLATDTVAREHYAGFDTDHARLVSLTEDKLQYVSYRKNNEVYWTKKRLLIPRGEVLITDGTRYARTRCGNMLSDAPHIRVLAKEPTVDISMPPLTPEDLDNPRIAFTPPPDITIPGDRPDVGGRIAQLLGAPEPLSHPLSGFPPMAGIPGFYPSGPLLIGTTGKSQSGSTPPGSTPITTGGSGTPVQPIPPPAVLIPEPRFLVPLGVGLLVFVPLWRVRRTRPTTPC